MKRPINSVTRPRLTRLLIFIAVVSLWTPKWPQIEANAEQFLNGFKASPDPSIPSFQPLLNDSTGQFSLGFLRVNRTQLALAVVHVSSTEPLWQANMTRLPRWSEPTQLTFNGSLVISDPHSEVFWSTRSTGDRVRLLNTSNLQVQKLDGSLSVVWQSFDFPTDTLVDNQNFTADMSLVSSNGVYFMRLGDNFLGLYANFKHEQNSDQIYWRHRALEAKADIIAGKGRIYARISSDGYLGMYQTEDTPVDVEAFDTFQRTVPGILRLRLEPDGNLKGYYLDGSIWVLAYQAIQDECDLPSRCGPYSLCQPGGGCSCLDNRTDHTVGECSPAGAGDLCGDAEGENEQNETWVFTRRGVDLAYKELMRFEKMGSVEECESACERNCSCWGVVFNNASGFCYAVDYPIQTLIGVGDEGKVGYFKVWKGARKKVKGVVGLRVGLGLLGGAAVSFLAVIGVGSYRMRRRKREIGGHAAEDGGENTGRYKTLGSASFRSLELSNR
ncbi:PAN domain-containing protein At5g03700 [Malania oleifera]|uniref:PAN domain-containing protein At5g03700 n=1 Tax=Malania oleifera TaxID=397392 RepID=UPI0025AEC97F|nr:PAN domain-containing protein At5g03700 [Malania oleifera]